MSKKIWSSVSFTIATFNSERTLDRCLSSIRNQSYPSDIEIVLGDGGSKDKTLSIAKKYGARVINIPTEKEGAEYNKGVAANNARNEILVMIDHDNILPHKNWLKNMITPLVEEREIIGSGVLRFHHDKKMTLLDRYFALIGGTDPVAVFFNKSAHQSHLYSDFHLRGKLLSDEVEYYHVELDANNLPALGGNGATLRRNLLNKAKSDPEHFFHIDIHHDLVEKGLKDYAFVKDSLIHLTNNKLFPFLKRRKFYVEKYYYQDRKKRRFAIYEAEKDKLKLFGYILYSLSVVLPFIDAVRGYIKVRDIAWFIHPLMCLGMLFVYGWPAFKGGIKSVFWEK